jgi:enoyl-CoA hydratase/carnithine racemase
VTAQEWVYTVRTGCIFSVVLNRLEKLNAITHAMIEPVRERWQLHNRIRKLSSSCCVALAGHSASVMISTTCPGQRRKRNTAQARGDASGRHSKNHAPAGAGGCPGYAVGASFFSLLHRDHVVCSKSTKAFFPELKMGSLADVAAIAGPRMLGVAAARQAFQRLKRLRPTSC